MKRFVLTFVAVMAFLISPAVVDSQQRDSASAALTALDYYEIEQLYARYCHGLDSGADDGYMYADVFTPDGTFVDQAGKVRAGREQLAELGRGGPGARRGPTMISHFVSNVAIEPAAGGATGKAYLLIAQAPNPAMGLRATLVNGGQYWDALVKTAEGWRFKNRTYHQAHPPAPSASAAPQASAPVASTGAIAERRAAKIRLSAADYADIYQLYGRYGYAFDGGLDTGNEWARLFTPDGFHSNASNNEWVKGSVALADFARGALQYERGFITLRRLEGSGKDPTRIAHIITNIMLEPTTEGVVAKAYRMIAGIGANGQPNSFLTAGMYFDLLVKTPRGWRYKEKFYMGTDIVPDLAKRFITPASSGRSADVFPASGAVPNTPPPAAAAGSTFTPDEYAELQQLYARSSVALDSSADNGAAYARWFTSDGVFTDAAGSVFAGRDKLAQVARGNPGSGKTPTTTQTFLYNLKLQRSAEGATGTAYVVIATINDAGQPITMNDGGQYHDALVNTAEGWRIKTRKFVRAAPGGVAVPNPIARSQWSPG